MKKEFACFLDISDKHPELFGECILPRDDDGMGFALNLENFRGKYVKITIEEIPVPSGLDKELAQRWCSKA